MSRVQTRMGRTIASIYSIAWRVAVVLLSVEIAAVSIFKYFTDTMPPPQPVIGNAFAQPYLAVHVISGVAALLLGPAQFVASIRERRPALHRTTGRLYVLACLVGAPSGLILALGTTAGPVAAVGFAIPALLWALFTALGVRAVLGRRIEEHRDWMLRSYAIMANAITLRLMLPASAFLGFDFLPAYQIIAWLGWITNLTLVELYIRRNRLTPAPRTRLAAA